MAAEDLEPLFQIGAVHECAVTFRAMRDRFSAGEVLCVDQRLYSIYDDITGWLFTDLDGQGRVWDIPGNPRHRTAWDSPADRDVLFRAVVLDDARLVALQHGDLAGLQSLLVVDHRVTPALTLAGMHALRQHDEEHLVATALRWLRPTTGLVAKLLWHAARSGGPGIARVLLSSGVPADGVSSDPPATPLFAAVLHDHPDVAATLLAGGADPDAPQGGPHTPRQLARLKGGEVARLFGWDLPAPPAPPGH